MLISHHMRRFVARLLVGLLVYAQLALAAYACSSALLPDAASPSGAAMALGEMPHKGGWASSSTMPAWQMDLAQPEMCAGHCQSAHQNIDIKPAPSPALTLMAGYFTLEHSAQRAVWGRTIVPAASPPPQVDPPHAILHCCFRI